MPTFSLKIKMTLVVFLMFGVVISTVAGIGLYFFTREFKSSVGNRQFSVVSAMAVELDDKILAAQKELAAVARSVDPALTRNPKALQRFLDGRLDVQQVFTDGTGYYSTEGVLLASSPGQDVLIGRTFASEEFHKRTVASGKPFISEPFRSSRGGDHPVIVFTAPVFDANGRMTGYLGGRLDLMEENLLGRLGRLKISDAGDFFLFNSRRQLIVHRDRDRLMNGQVSRDKELVARAISGFEGSDETMSRSGHRVLCSFKRLKSTGWILGAALPVSEAYATTVGARSFVLWSLSLALPAALLAVWLFVGRLTKPLLTLTKGVSEVGGDGAGFKSLPVTTGDEIGVLARAFNEVMQELGSQRALLEREKRLAEQLLQNTAVPCYVIDADHRVIIWNRACEELTGFRAADILGSSEPWRAFYDSPRHVLADIVVDNNLEEMAEIYGCYSDSPLIPEGLRAEGWLMLKGKQKFLTYDAAPIRDAEGRVIAAIETLQDVTMRARNEERLRGMVAAIGESEERFRRLVELSLDGIAILVARRFVFVNPAGCDLLGVITADELLGREMRDFIQRDSAALFEEQLGYTEASGSNAPWIEERLVRRDGTTVEVEIGMSRFVHRGEEALQVIFRDITERKLAKARLETLAHYDALTSLPNRVLFFDRLQHAVSEAKRHQHPLALMYLDLDRFKEVNDSFGHAAGDAVLVESGRRLKDCLRACDMVARMGGDEFTIILTKMAEEVDAAVVAERIVESLSLPFEVAGHIAHIGVSIGICIYPTYGPDLDGMVRQADVALYRAKEDGRNGYCFYSPDLEKKAVNGRG